MGLMTVSCLGARSMYWPGWYAKWMVSRGKKIRLERAYAAMVLRTMERPEPVLFCAFISFWFRADR